MTMTTMMGKTMLLTTSMKLTPTRGMPMTITMPMPKTTTAKSMSTMVLWQ